jgi:DNA-binding response OmpR family regulator
MERSLKQFNILYAEDELGLQKSMVDYLERHFNKVYVAENGKEALEKYQTFKPDILMLDIDMPYVDGLEVAKEVRKTNTDIPILIFTAYDDKDKLMKAIELNLCTYMMKPVDPFKFQEALQKIGAKLSSNIFNFSNESIWNFDTEKLIKNGSIIELTLKEKTLLKLFIDKHKACVEFTDIMATVWVDDFDAEISIDAVKKQVSFLRKKLPKNSIKNVYGKGYILN